MRPERGGSGDAPVIPSLSVVLASTPACGAGALARALGATGAMPRPRSYFDPRRVPAHAERLGIPRSASGFLDRYLNELIEQRTSRDGVFSVQLRGDHLAYLVRALRALPLGSFTSDAALVESWIAAARYVFVDRDDLSAQAVEWFGLRRPARFAAGPPARPGWLRRDLQEIRWLEELSARQRLRWQQFFGGARAAPVVVSGAEAAVAPGAAADSVLAALGLDAARQPHAARRQRPIRPVGSAAPETRTRWLEAYEAERSGLEEVAGARRRRTAAGSLAAS